MRGARLDYVENAGVTKLLSSHVRGRCNTLWTDKRNQCRHLSRKRFPLAGWDIL
jgi:hypothetical protein